MFQPAKLKIRTFYIAKTTMALGILTNSGKSLYMK